MKLYVTLCNQPGLRYKSRCYCTFSHHCSQQEQMQRVQGKYFAESQGRIKVRGGPRLDTVMGPYPFSFLIKLRHHRLRTLSFGVPPLESLKLQMPVCELSFRALLRKFCRIIRPIFVRMNLQFLPAQSIKVQSHNEYQFNTVMNRNQGRINH